MNIIDTPKFEERVFADGLTQSQVDTNAQIRSVQRNLHGMDVNYAASNLWIAMLPLENILGPKFGDLNLHLTRFSLPQQVMATNTVSWRGYSKEIPGKILTPDSKELTLEYIVDENWKNYKALYAWQSGLRGVLNPATEVDKTQQIQPSDYIPLHIKLLDNFKRSVVSFEFSDCFLKVFNDLSLEQNNSDVITHSFTFCYDEFKIEDVD